MKTISMLVLLIAPVYGYSQNLGSYADAANLVDIMRTAASELRIKTGEAYGTLGTPNVFKEFKSGNIYFTNKSVASNLTINYDCFRDRVLYNKGEVNYILNSRTIDYLQFNISKDSSVLFRQVFIPEKKKTVFMRILYNGETTLYKHYYKTYQEADYTGPYSQDRRYNEFIDGEHFYIGLPGKDPVRLKPKKKSVLEILEAAGTDIEKYLKKEKPDLKTDMDLIRLVQYYDGIIRSR
jgi:hypothetical protein